jgi:Ca2+-binding RTX toxin-like protein
MTKLYFEGVSYSADALNDEESTGTDVTTTELNLDQFYQGTISSQLSDSTDIDLYSFEVVEGQTYSLAYSSHGNVIGWNAQTPDPAQIYNSDFNLTFSLKTTDDQEIDLQYEFNTRRTTDSSDYTSANFYSFTAEKTETLYLEVAPRTTGTSSYYADKKQDYGFLIQNLSGNGLHNTTDNKLLGSIFDDELTITAIENAALDYSYQKYFLSGNDNITVDAQGIYNWNLGSDYHLGEGNDFIEIINEAYVSNNTYQHIALHADGGVGDDVLRGGAGNDTLTGGNGADQLTGGAGDDTLQGDCDNRDLWWCHYESIEKIGANDIIDAGAGDDTIIGGAGADTVTGGTGKDTFIFEVSEDFGDTITDFNVDEDYIVLFQPINQQNLTDKAFDDFVRVTQSGNDAVVQLDLSGNASQWTTVATLENLDAQTVSKDNFVSLNKLKTNEDNHTLYFEGVSYSADALNDEESTGTDVTTTELNLDQFYQGTISSQLSDSTDIDLYSFEVVEGQTYSLAYSSHGNVIGWNAQTPDPAQIYNSDFNLTFSLKTTDDQEIDLQYEFDTRRTTDSSNYTSANFYSFTAEKTETLYLEVAPANHRHIVILCGQETRLRLFNPKPFGQRSP